MFVARINGDLTGVPTASGQRGSCPQCGSEVTGHCGEQKTHHWAHLPGVSDCDSWGSGPMTQWHLDWQERVPIEQREVVIGNHRADIVVYNPSTWHLRVVEFQHSSIGADEIRARQEHYGDMLWVFDAINPYEEGRLTLNQKSSGIYGFRWKHARTSIEACLPRTVILDIGDGFVLLVGAMWWEGRSTGWGMLTTIEGLTRYWPHASNEGRTQ